MRNSCEMGVRKVPACQRCSHRRERSFAPVSRGMRERFGRGRISSTTVTAPQSHGRLKIIAQVKVSKSSGFFC